MYDPEMIQPIINLEYTSEMVYRCPIVALFYYYERDDFGLMGMALTQFYGHHSLSLNA